MATNTFSKEEKVAFDQAVNGFEDACVISDKVAKYSTAEENMERSSDVIWRPVPYIMNSQTRVVGTDITFQDVKQLSVPSTIGYAPSVPWTMTALELRDALQEGTIYDAALDRLSSDVNTAVRDIVSLQGTLVSVTTGAAGDYDDISDCQSLMSEQGIAARDRYMALTTRDYNGMAGNLASRANMMGKKVEKAYEASYVGRVAGFETYEIDAGKRIAAVSATPTIATNGAQVRYAPLSSESSTAGQINVDNRYQTVTVSSTSGVTAGAAFTVAGIEAVHQVTKESTSQLKTFRVISVDSGTTMTISPPMIGANSSPGDEELAYKNIEVASTSATAAITFLNDTATGANPFWFKDSIELLPAGYAVPTDQGVAVMKTTTKQGIEVVMTKFFRNKGFVSEIAIDARFGVVNKNPEMNGIKLFNQS